MGDSWLSIAASANSLPPADEAQLCNFVDPTTLGIQSANDGPNCLSSQSDDPNAGWAYVPSAQEPTPTSASASPTASSPRF